MCRAIGTRRDRRRPRRRHLEMDTTLLEMRWRFLANLNNKTGFSTAWMQPQSLLKQADRREKEYQDSIMASLAVELGVTCLFPVVQRDGNNKDTEKVSDTLNARPSAETCVEQTGVTSSAQSIISPRPSFPEPQRSPQKAKMEKPPALISAVKEGGVRFPLQVETDKLISPNRVEAADHAETLTTYSTGQKVTGDGERLELVPARPATPPALLMYEPSLRVRIAKDVPRELKMMPGVSSPKSIWRGGKLAQKRRAEAPPNQPPFRRASRPTPASRRTSYGKAWYLDPNLWGVADSNELMYLVRKGDNEQGVKQLLAHLEAVKSTIPTLFSAARFVEYIRKQGLRMPAHLESTDRAMRAEETKTGQGQAPTSINGKNSQDYAQQPQEEKDTR